MVQNKHKGKPPDSPITVPDKIPRHHLSPRDGKHQDILHEHQAKLVSKINAGEATPEDHYQFSKVRERLNQITQAALAQIAATEQQGKPKFRREVKNEEFHSRYNVEHTNIEPRALDLLHHLGISKGHHLLKFLGAPTHLPVEIHNIKSTEDFDYPPGRHGVSSYTFGPHYSWERILFPHHGYIRNEFFRVTPSRGGTGSGIFNRYAHNASKAGFKEMRTYGAKNKTQNGHYSWPRMGYDAEFEPYEQEKLPHEYRHAQTIQHLFSMPGGMKWWQHNGWGKSMTFDLRPISDSMKINNAYMLERAKRPPERVEHPELSLNTEEKYEEIHLEPWEEDALDRVWAKKVGQTTNSEPAFFPDPSEKFLSDWGRRGGRLYGYRSHAEENEGGKRRSFSNVGSGTEGIGMYIAGGPSGRELASQFGGRTRRVSFKPPKNPLIIDNEPLHILHETDEMMEPPNERDSPWLSANKEAVRRSGTTNENWGHHLHSGKLTRALTDVIKERGHDSVMVNSGGDKWVVLFHPENHDIRSYWDGQTRNDEQPEHQVQRSYIHPDALRTLKRRGITSQSHLLHVLGAPTHLPIYDHRTVADKQAGVSPIINTQVTSPHYWMKRYIDTTHGIVTNGDFHATETGTGLGSQIFHNQVKQLSNLGFLKIKTFAAKHASVGKGMNGYYTWPTLGYNGLFSGREKNKLPREYRHADSLHELYDIPGGRDWWKANGWEKPLEFDLRKGSESHKRLENYMQERNARLSEAARNPKGTHNSASHIDDDIEELDLAPWEEEALEAAERERMEQKQQTHNDINSGFEEIDLSPEEEAALERVWAKRIKEANQLEEEQDSLFPPPDLPIGDTTITNAENDIYSGDKYFNEEALHEAENQPSKSREILVRMPTSHFISMAEKIGGPDAHIGRGSIDKRERVERVLDSGDKFRDIPLLGFEHNGSGTAYVVSHEGRHRALALQSRGTSHIPVRLVSYAGGGGGSIRWQSQEGIDRIRGDWPKHLIGQGYFDESTQRQVAGEKIPFPVEDLRKPTTNAPTQIESIDHQGGKWITSSNGPGHLVHILDKEPEDMDSPKRRGKVPTSPISPPEAASVDFLTPEQIKHQHILHEHQYRLLEKINEGDGHHEDHRQFSEIRDRLNELHQLAMRRREDKELYEEFNAKKGEIEDKHYQKTLKAGEVDPLEVDHKRLEERHKKRKSKLDAKRAKELEDDIGG